MIVSHKHKFIFIKTRKTAGTSIEIALSKICGKDDIISPISPQDELMRKKLGIYAQNYNIPLGKYNRLNWAELFLKFNRKIYYNHMPATEIREYVGENIWNSYYKFCFERNPFDKIISHYYNRHRDEDINIKSYIEKGHMRWIKGFDMYTDGGNVIVDKIYKYEHLDDALEDISRKIGCKVELESYKAKGNFRKDRRNYSEILSETEKEKIAIMFAREIKLLNYKY